MWERREIRVWKSQDQHKFETFPSGLQGCPGLYSPYGVTQQCPRLQGHSGVHWCSFLPRHSLFCLPSGQLNRKSDQSSAKSIFRQKTNSSELSDKPQFSLPGGFISREPLKEGMSVHRQGMGCTQAHSLGCYVSMNLKG